LFKLDGWHIFNSKFLLQPHRQQCRWWCFHQSIRFPTSPLPVFYLTMTYYFLWVYADYVQIDFILFTSRRISVEINLSVILPYFKYVKTHRIMPMGIADACPAVPFLPHSTSEFQCQPNRCVIMSHSWLRSCISMTMLELEPLPTVFFFFFFWWTFMHCSGFSIDSLSFGRLFYIFPFLPAVLYCMYRVTCIFCLPRSPLCEWMMAHLAYYCIFISVICISVCIVTQAVRYIITVQSNSSQT
jgi:hypothetical protein